MPDRIISAEAVITGKDATGDMFANLAKKMQSVGKSANISPQVDQMVKSLGKAELALKAIDKLQIAQNRSGLSRSQFDKARSAAEAAAKAIQSMDGPSKKAIADYDRLAAAAAKAADGVRRQATAVQVAKSAAEGLGVGTNNIVVSQERLRGVIDQTTHALQRQVAAERVAAQAQSAAHKAQERRADGIAHHGIGRYAAQTAATYVGAHSVVSGVEHTLKAGARYQHEIVSLQNAGRTPEEMHEIEERSREVSRRLPTASFEENLKVVNETTGAFGTLHHALENLEFMQKASSVLQSAAGDKIHGGAGELGNKLARFFEERQVAGDTPTFQREAEGLIRAMAFTRGNFNPEQAMNFAQQSKSALPNFSERFLTKIAPSLITMMGGDRAGTAANAFNSVITGKVNDKKQAEEWARYGLLDKSMVTMKAGHAVGWRAGAVKGTDLAMTDPLRWAEEVALPAMKAKGVNVDDRMALTKALATMFRNQNSNMWANELMQGASRSRLHKDEANINQAGTMDTIYNRNLQSDPTAALTALKASLDNLMTSASSPAMAAAAKGITMVSGALSGLANWGQQNPKMAMGAGATVAGAGLAGAGLMSYQLLNGFGLRPAASELMTAARMLQGASGHPGVPGGMPGGGSPAGKPLGLGGRGLPLFFSTLGLMLDQPDPNKAPPLEKHIDGLNQWWDKNTPAWMPGHRGQIGPYGMAPDFRQPTVDETRQQQDLRSAYDRSRPPPYGALGMFDYGAGSPMSSNGIPMPIRRPAGVENMPGPMAPVEVHSTIDTNAVVKVEVTATEGLLARQTFQSVVSKPGVGVSMPQAAAGTPAAAPGH